MTSGDIPDDSWVSTVREDYANLAAAMKEAYGENIEMLFIDLDRGSFKDYPNIAKLIQMGYSLPLVMINGVPRFSGSIKVDSIMNLVGELIASK